MHHLHVPRNLPAGTVTFLFTDVEGSTKLLHELGSERYAAALTEHRRLLRAAFTRYGGVEVDSQGDAFFVAFPTAPGARAAAAEAQAALSGGPIRVRMGLHTGTPFLGDEGYIGPDVHRAARIAAAGYGGQVLVSSATAQLLDRDDFRDLGQHRLKDLSGPERLYQLGEAEYPPLRTLHQTNLPVPATAFLGREAEVAEVGALLARDGVRLVTLTGPGGTGKTRLALAVAGGLAERYPDGVWWVPLAPLRDPALVLESASGALGASNDLAEHIGDKRLLLLLDNFEHLTPAADDLAPLLARCPNLSLLVTSREPLHISGEHEYAVDPLREPEALELFLTRALAAKRDFVANSQMVTHICERLDHLPLAIELAAARVKVLSPQALLQRLERRLPMLAGGARDLPERQRTLRATIEWSHELLAPDEQRLFARLAVFRGGCTLEAAEAVAGADLDTLQSLVDKSLLRVRDDRFWMLETIREYAAERLAASGEADELRRSHATFFLSLAEEAEPGLHATPKASLDLLEPEHDNVRAAFEELAISGEGQDTLRMAGAMWRYWFWRGHFHEGIRLIERALHLGAAPTAARAKSLVGATALANAREQPTAKRWAEEAVAVYSKLGDRSGAAYARLVLGGLLADAGDTDKAQKLFLEAMQAFEELGDEHYLLLARSNLATGHEELGDREAARALHQENLARARAAGNQQIEWMSLIALGTMAGQEGRLKEAASLLSEAHSITREIGDPAGAAIELGRLAAILAGTRRAAAIATRLLAKAELVYQETGATIAASDARMNARTIGTLRRQLGEASFTGAWVAGQGLGVDEATSLGLDALNRAVP